MGLLTGARDAGDRGSFPGWGRAPGGGNDNPLLGCLILLYLPGKFHGQRSLAGRIHGVTKSQMCEILSTSTQVQPEPKGQIQAST